MRLRLLAAAATLAVATGAYAESRVIVRDDADLRDAIRAALATAQTLSAAPECANAFPKFALTQERMTSLYLGSGEGSRQCLRPSTFAYTATGSPTIFVCARFLKAAPELRPFLLLHEAFHSAGLPEDGDAASIRITERVVKVCQR